MSKSDLGFRCGKSCARCGEPVSLDAQGRYTCFTCGCFVEVVETTETKDEKHSQ